MGGEINYKYLGGNSYEIRVTMYRDCYNGVPPFDDPAALGVFDSANVLITWYAMPFLGLDTLQPSIQSPCLVPPTDVCYEVTTYIDTINLPPRPGGYILAYQRCCRNVTIQNIINPSGTGATYVATIPDTSVVIIDSNPKFNYWPPTFICVNTPFTFDHSATDLDGDSLVYRLCVPLDGATPAQSMPQPPNPPPFIQVVWNPPYSLANALGGTPLTINPQTGLLTAIPNTLGQFVYGICCDEYRNGVYIGETHRDFQINIVACPNITVASIQSPLVRCGSDSAQFTNNSFGAATYFWDFGVPSLTNDTSNLANPLYIYPDTGYYNVMLVAYSGVNPGCNDTSYGVVHILPEFSAGFSFSHPICSNTVTFVDSFSVLSGTPNAWFWNFGDSTSSTVPNPVHTYDSLGGTFTVTMIVSTDEGCADTVTHIIVLPQLLASVFTSVVNASCPTFCDGSATVSISGGTGPYNILWSNAQTTATASNLCPGAYWVTLSDANGCTFSDTVNIIQAFTGVGSNISAASCANVCNGQATANPTGGTAPYTYMWSNGQTTQTATNLCAGNFTVTITDANGCTTTVPVSITTSFTISIPSSQNNPCYNDCLGQATALAVGGTAPYIYAWNNSQNTQIATGLCQGTYIVIITDANGCSSSDTVQITEPPELLDTITGSVVSCTSLCDGTVTVTPSGGVPPYTFLWNDGAHQTSSTATGLCPGTYIVVITDSAGCQQTDSALISASLFTPPISVTASPDTLLASQSSNLTSIPAGGYSYLWTPATGLSNATIANPVATPQVTTTYIVTVTDVNGCRNQDTVTIVVYQVYCNERDIYIPNAFTPDGNGHNDILYVRGRGITEMYFTVYDRWGEMVYETNDLTKGWDGTFKGKPCDPDVFVYYIKVTCFNGETYFKKGNITLIR